MSKAPVNRFRNFNSSPEVSGSGYDVRPLEVGRHANSRPENSHCRSDDASGRCFASGG